MKDSPQDTHPKTYAPRRWSAMAVIAAAIPLIYCLGVLSVIEAQTPATTENTEKEEDKNADKKAYLRVWAVLGNVSSPESYTLSWESNTEVNGVKEATLFEALQGCWRSGFSDGYFEVPPEKCKITLKQGDKNGAIVQDLEEKFAAGSAHSLLVALENGKPVLKLIKESPTPVEEDGVFIYHLLSESPLTLKVGESAGQTIAPSLQTPTFLAPTKIAGQVLTFVYPSKRRTEINKQVEYAGKGRLSVVYMRNEHSQPGIFVFSSAPEK